MAIISKVKYTPSGELLAPTQGEIQSTGVFTGKVPTYEPGHYHRFIIAAKTQDELFAKIARFFAHADHVPGFNSLRVTWRKAVADYSADIIYVVLQPKAVAGATRGARTRVTS